MARPGSALYELFDKTDKEADHGSRFRAGSETHGRALVLQRGAEEVRQVQPVDKKESGKKASPRRPEKKRKSLLTAQELIGESRPDVGHGLFSGMTFAVLHAGKLFPGQEAVLRKVVKEGGQLTLYPDVASSLVLTTCDTTFLTLHRQDLGQGTHFLPLSFVQVCLQRGKIVNLDEYNLLQPKVAKVEPLVQEAQTSRSTGFRKWADKTPEPETQVAHRDNKDQKALDQALSGDYNAQDFELSQLLEEAAESEDDINGNEDIEAKVKPNGGCVSNETVILELEKLLSYYEATNDTFRTWAYRRAIRVLKNFGTRAIASLSHQDLVNVPGIGASVAGNVTEIIESGALRKAQIYSARDREIRLFMTIHGVGRHRAEIFYNQGWRTLDDCRRHRDSLDPIIRLGLEYYDDLQIKIGRPEALAIFDFVRETFDTLDQRTSGFLEGPMGSYRRGATESGDVDILLIGRPDEGNEFPASALVQELIKNLYKKDFVSCTLASPSKE